VTQTVRLRHERRHGKPYLLIDRLFGTEQFIKTSFFDLFEQCRGDIHVRVKRRLTSSEFGKLCYSCLQVCCIRRNVAVCCQLDAFKHLPQHQLTAAKYH
jgi:hypothetical protein